MDQPTANSDGADGNGTLNTNRGCLKRLGRYRTAPPHATPTNNTWVDRNYPYEGFLLGAGDVIYVHTKQAAYSSMSFLLWPYGENRDFDLYVSDTNSLPSHGTAVWEGRNIDAPELVYIPPYIPPSSLNCTGWPSDPEACRERWLYVAIHSFSGTGQFRFYANIHAYHAPRDLTINVAHTTTEAQ